VRGLFETEWTSSAEVYLPGGRATVPGEPLRNPALAATWRRLIAEAEAAVPDRAGQTVSARQVWRTGFVAEALVRRSGRPTMDTSGERHTGALAAEDLAGWSATYEAPVTYDWNGWPLHRLQLGAGGVEGGGVSGGPEPMTMTLRTSSPVAAIESVTGLTPPAARRSRRSGPRCGS
jgi:gamma-glutamyltranspeptidase